MFGKWIIYFLTNHCRVGVTISNSGLMCLCESWKAKAGGMHQ